MSAISLDKILTYDDLLTALDKSGDFFSKGARGSRWSRYVSRRLPLYSAVGFSIYLSSALLLILEDIDLKMVEDALAYLRSVIEGELANIVGLLLLRFVAGMLIFKKKWLEATTSLCLAGMMLAILMKTLESKHALILGLVCFSVIFLTSMVADRTLGYTSRNERYLMFQGKTEALKIIVKSQRHVGEALFSEHVQAFYKLWDEYRQRRHGEAVSDSFYLLRQVEQRLPQL